VKSLVLILRACGAGVIVESGLARGKNNKPKKEKTMTTTNQDVNDKNKTLEHMEYVHNAREVDAGGRVISVTELHQEILDAGFQGKDVMMFTEITWALDLRYYCTDSFLVFRLANWLVVIRKRKENEGLTLPEDAEPLMVKDASITGHDKADRLELHVSTSSLEAKVNREGVNVHHSFSDEESEMAGDTPVKKPVESVTVQIMAVSQAEGTRGVEYSEFDYQFPQAA
jgi:hypothetical protein